MRVLFATANPGRTAPPFRLGAEQVTCGPGLIEERAGDGRLRAFPIPPGDYDIAALAAKLPAGQRPDVVVCEIDAAHRGFPRNLAALACPTVALVGGTHTGATPLSGLLRELAAAAFDRVVLLDNRHHAPFFHAAGVRHLHWFPGLLFPHSDAAVRAARQVRREPCLAVVGAVGGEPPRPARLWSALAARPVPLVREIARAPNAALKRFGGSLLGGHASDNGELGLRVFEILAAGGALLTDRLAPESGFEQLFLEGREVTAYGSATELANLVQDLLARPDEAREVGEAGARWFDEHLGERRRREFFRRLALEGEALPEFTLTVKKTTRVLFDGESGPLADSLRVYEEMQGLHRTQETVQVAIDRETPDDIVEIYSTLPRVALSRLSDGGPADLAIVSRAHEDAAGVATAARRWFYDAAAAGGLAFVSPKELLNWQAPIALARQHESEGRRVAAEVVLREAVQRQGGHGELARALGDLLKRGGRLTEAQVWHRRALGCGDPVPERSPHRRRRALLVVQQGACWPGVASVYAAFDADPAWETIVIGLPFNHPAFAIEAQRNAVFRFLRQQNVPCVRWDEFPLGPGCADVVFLPEADDSTRPPGWRTEDWVRRGVRVVSSPAGFDAADDEESRERHYNRPMHQLGWAVCAWSEAHKARFRRHCAVGDAHVVVTGHPRTDALRKLDAARDPELERFIAGRRTVCWAPHYDVRPDGRTPFGRGRSTFARWQEFLPAEFARRRDLAFVVRPHPLFFPTLERAGVFTTAQLDAFEDRCAAAGNVHLDRRASCLPALAASAALLSDRGSLLTEFAFTGRPVLYLRNPHEPPADAPALAEDFGAVAETAADIGRFLDRVAAGEDERRSAQRRAHARKLFHLPAGGAGAAIKGAIERRLLDEEHGVVPARTVAAA